MPDVLFDEALLVERAIAGEGDAFGELYRHYLNAIYRYIYMRVGNANDAEDLTEQVFLNAWRALPTYQQRGFRFTSWLYQIAHNIVIGYHRQHKPTIPLSQLENDGWESRQISSLDQIIEAEEIRALNTAINQLPTEHQQVINLRFVEGLNHTEVARIIDKSAGASRMIQYRALTMLGQLLGNSAVKAAGIILACTLWLLLGGGGIVYGSTLALPGDTLYPLKTVAETVQLITSFNETGDARLHLAFARRRLEEAAKLLARGRLRNIEQALKNYSEHLNAVVVLLGQSADLSANEQIKLANLLLILQADHKAQLTHLLDQSPESVHQVITTALQESEASRETALKIIEGNPPRQPAESTPTPPPPPTPQPSGSPLTPLPALSFTPTPVPPAATTLPLPVSSPTSPSAPTPTPTITPTSTPTPASTSTSTSTSIPTATPTATPTFTSTPMPTATFTPIPTATFTPIPTATFTPIPTPTPLPTATPEPPTPTPQPTSPGNGFWPQSPDEWPDNWPWPQRPPGWPDPWPWPGSPADWPGSWPWPDSPDDWPWYNPPNN